MEQMHQADIRELLQALRGGETADFRPIVFWSWNGALERNELLRQIAEMDSQGLGGFVIHARAGLRTEYLSDEWFELVGACLDRARELGMSVWIYDEYGWPSGFVGGKLLEAPENRACYLTLTESQRFAPDAYAVFVRKGTSFQRVTACCGAERYYCVCLRESDAYADILNPRVVEQFVRETHEKYYARFSDRFGRELAGFFTDEPQYYRYATPISRVTEEEYRREWGEELKDGLIWLFVQDPAGYPFRCRYYNLMNRLYTENYYKRLYDWCGAHGCMLTGHSVEETFHFTQMWGGADCASTYDFEHVPGMDNLTLDSPALLSAKLLGSAAAQLGARRCLSETFGCSGYGATPDRLRIAAEKQAVCGVNYFCQHLYNYTNSGQGKLDHPPVFGRALPWQSAYRAFNDYFARLGYLLSLGEEQIDCAVLSPMQSIYLDYLRDREERARLTDEAFFHTLEQLRREGITYHLLNEKLYARHGSVQGASLRVGRCSYRTVVLSAARNLTKRMAEALREFGAQGGRLICIGERPVYADGEPFDYSFLPCGEATDIPARRTVRCALPMDYTVRSSPFGELVFAVNQNEEPAELQLRGEYSRLDLVTLELRAAGNGLTLPPHGSALLLEGSFGAPLPTCMAQSELKLRACDSTPNILVLDEPEVETEDGKRSRGSGFGIFESLVRSGYSGRITVRYRFAAAGGTADRLIVERTALQGLRLNGAPLEPLPLPADGGFCSCEISKLVRKGENEILYTAELKQSERVARVLYDPAVPESLRNCIAYDTFLDPVYVVGNFSLDSAGRLAPPVLPEGSDLTACGRKFFAGTVSYCGAFTAPAEEAVLRLSGDYASCEVKLDGNSRGLILFGDSLTLTGLCTGKSYRLEIVCASTLRNVLGPFHSTADEREGVSPDSFTFRGKWKGSECPGYREAHRVVPFGVSRAVLEWRQPEE